jgi:hypothetical protein
MSKIYTATDLIRYIYRETTPAENAGILHQMHADEAFKEEFENQLATLLVLNEAELDPSPTSVSLILEHSLRQHEVHN